MHEHASPLHVAQEGMAQAGPRAGALDEPRQVGDGGPALVGGVVHGQVQHAQVRLEGREGVVGHLGPGCREGRQERGLARVGKAHEADVGDEPQLQPQAALLAGLALLGMLGRLVGGRGEVRVAEAASAAPRHHEALGREDEVRP